MVKHLPPPSPSLATYTEAVDMLERVRPGGPWLLSAIIPDGVIKTVTARTADEVRKFISAHNGKRNLYFSVNPTRHAMDKKASKLDLAAIEYIHGDLDPRDDESPEDAKARFRAAIEAYLLAAAEIIDSGNGVQALHRLAEPIILAEPVMRPDENGELVLKFSEENELKIAEVEGCAELLMQTLGSVAGTQNIDRILRLPGTINLPNAKKLRDGRTACATKSISFSSARHLFESFPKPIEKPKVEPAPQQQGETSQTSFNFFEGTQPAELETLVRDGVPVGQRSDQFYHAVKWLKDESWPLAHILTLLRKHPKGIAAKYAKPDKRLKAETERAFHKANREDAKGAESGHDADINNIILTAAALENLPPPTEWKYCDYIGRAAHGATDGEVQGFRAWYRWTQRSSVLVSCRYIYRGLGDFGHAQKEWLNYFKSPPNEIGLATLLDLADRADSNWRDKLSEEFWRRVVSS
jgi:hypothetical protein